MTLSDKVRFRIGIGLVTFPVFIMGLILGIALALFALVQPANAATQGELGMTSAASLEIVLVIPEKPLMAEEVTAQTRKLGSELTPTVIVNKDGKMYVEPV